MVGTCADGLSCVNGKCADLSAAAGSSSGDRTGEVYEAGEDPHVILGNVKKPEPEADDGDDAGADADADGDAGAGAGSGDFLSRFNNILSRYHYWTDVWEQQFKSWVIEYTFMFKKFASILF